MTREEAINELKILREEYWDDDGYGHETQQYDDTITAIDMAIKLLEQEPDTWSLEDAREDFMDDVYNTLDFLPTNDEANQIIDSFDRVTSSIRREPCEDCISRADVLGLAKKGVLISNSNYQSVCKAINELPSVTPKYTDEEIDRAQAIEQAYIDKMVELAVEESKKVGHWINLEETKYKGQVLPFWSRYECSKCGGYGEGTFNYCPNCGADMRESEDEK